MQFNRLVEALKSRLRLIVLSSIFLGLTTWISVIMIYIMARIGTKITIPGKSLGMIIIGSIFGQVTLLIAIPLVDKLGKAVKGMAEVLNDELDEYIRDGKDPNDT